MANSFPYVSRSFPYEAFSPMEAMEDSEVEEAECLGESTGDAMAVDGEDTSDSTVVDVMVRRRAGFCLGAVAVEAMINLCFGRKELNELVLSEKKLSTTAFSNRKEEVAERFQ
jgi:hypothetical protein